MACMVQDEVDAGEGGAGTGAEEEWALIVEDPSLMYCTMS